MRRVQKPIRLHVLMIFIVLAYGIMPFVSAFPYSGGFLLIGPHHLPLNGSMYMLYGPEGNAPFLLVCVTLFLCVFSAASAIWAFVGFTEGRTATLIFVTLDVLWWSLLVILALSQSDIPRFIGLVYELVPPIFWLAFIWWNFTRPDVSEYYRYQSQIQT